MVDETAKKKDIIDDYYSTIGRFMNTSDLILSKKYEINSTDNEEVKKIKEGQQRQILVDLGMILEFSFKYLIKIRRMNLYPNEPYLDVNNNGNIIKGFQSKEPMPKGVVRDLGNLVHAPANDIQAIENVTSVGPKSHDFYYLYLIIEKLMPDVSDRLKEFMKLKIKSDNISKIFEENEVEYPSYTVFPNDRLRTKEVEDEERKQIVELISKRNLIIQESGDIFTRLRYYSNNPFDKTYNIDEIYDVVTNVISFIKTVHLYEEELNFDPEIAFSYYKLNENPNLSKFSLEEISKIYSHPKIKNNVDNIMDSIFYSNDMSFKEVMEILDSDDLFEKNSVINSYTTIFTNSLTLEKIKYFRSIGIDDYEQMAGELMPNPFKVYSLEEYKELRRVLEADKYPGILLLTQRFSIQSINKLKKFPNLLNFFICEFNSNVNIFSYRFKDSFIDMFLSIDEILDNPNAWYGLDTDQLKIYYDISNVLLKEPANNEIINRINYDFDTIKENIKNNIEYFKDDQKMLCVMPLMLDCEDNQKILNILVKNGLNTNDLKGFDSTIFCFPLKLVELIEKIFALNNIPLIVNNKVNPFIMNVITIICNNYKSDIEINPRRIIFTKNTFNEDFINPTKNPVVDELLCEDREILEHTYLDEEKSKEYENKIKEMSEKQISLILKSDK